MEVKINVLFGTHEYFIHASDIGPATVRLAPALMKKGINTAVVTPFFDAYNDLYKNKDVEFVTSIKHIYKGKQFISDIFRVSTEIIAGLPVYHYLIKPEKESPLGWLFNIENDGTKIYHSFKWSAAHNRREYFNSAVAAMLRLPDPKLPVFDIYHAHNWHAAVAGVIAKEMENFPKWVEISSNYNKPSKKIPYMISTIYMFMATEQLTSKKIIRNYLRSLGFPNDYIQRFDSWKQYINHGNLNQTVLTLLYSDHVTTVLRDNNQGFDSLFKWLDQQQRFNEILNGIEHEEPDKKYQELYVKMLHRPLLRLDQIRSVYKPLLSMLTTIKHQRKNIGPQPQKVYKTTK